MKRKFTFLSISVFCLAATLFAQNSANSLSAMDYYKKGKAFQSEGDYFSATEQYQEAVLLNPNYADVWFALAECSYEMNEMQYALDCLEKSEKSMKNSLEVMRLKGFCYIALGRTKEAYEIFGKVSELYPNDVETMFGLAQLKILEGSFSSAENYYLEALTRQSTNKKALLSLALISLKLGKKQAAQNFINQAIRYHSDESQVYYFASYIALQNNELSQSEKLIKTALSLDADSESANSLYSYILYEQGRFSKALEVCEKRISIERNSESAWYTKALCEYRLGKIDASLFSLNTALKINPQDEMARYVAEFIVCENLSVEDARRVSYAKPHTLYAKDSVQKFDYTSSLFEFIRSLKIDPLNQDSRLSYADWLLSSGYPEYSLEQLKFLQEQGKVSQDVQDRIESYDSYLGQTLAKQWGKNALYLDKNRVSLGFYYYETEKSILHADSTQFCANLLSQSFEAYPYFSIKYDVKGVKSYSESFKDARNKNLDYFAFVHFDENERENTINVEIFSTKTGISCNSWTCYRTGNRKLQNAVQKICESIVASFELRGKIIDRNASQVLIDLGSRDGVKLDSQFLVVKKGAIKNADSKIALEHDKDSELGTVKITKLSEDLCQGDFSRFGYYDRMNVGDEVVIITDEDAEKKHSEFNPNDLMHGFMMSEFSNLLNSIR